MSASSYAIRDSVTMLERDLRRALRFPLMTLSGIFMPLLMLLFFVNVFGGAMSAGLGIGSYIDYIAPAIIIMAVCSGSALTAVNVSSDMTDGIMARFRTMSIFRPAVLVGSVFGSTIRTLIGVGLVIAAAMLMGFQPVASPIRWAFAIVIIALLTFAIQWLAVAIGLLSKSAGGANAATLPLQFAPFVSSAFVDPASMPQGLAWFAQHQPFTPIIDTIRGLLVNAPLDNSFFVAILWCIDLALIGYFWAGAVYNRAPAR